MAEELLPDLAESPGHVIWRAAAAVNASIATELPKTLDIHAYAALLALSDGQPRSQQSLAEATSVSRTTMTKVVAALTEAGLVERVRNPEDRRSYVLTRTQSGDRTVRQWRADVEALETSHGAAFTPAERAELRDLLVAAVAPTLAPDTPEPLRSSIGFLVTRLHARLHAAAADRLRDLDLEPRHLGTMTILHHGSATSQNELARFLGVSGATVTEIVDGLAAPPHLVVRVRGATDRRNFQVHMTLVGEQRFKEAKKRGKAVVRDVLAPLTKAQRTRLVELLVRLVSAD